MRKLIQIFLALTLVVSLGITAEPAAEAEAASKGFSYETLSNGTIKLTRYNGKAKKVTIPKKIKGKKVTELGGYLFMDRRQVTSLKIPEGIIKIEDMAFFSMLNLKKIYFPISVKKMSKRCGIGYADEATDMPRTTITCYKGSAALKCVAKHLSHYKIVAKKTKKRAVYFEPAGGTCQTLCKLVKSGGKYGKLPKAAREGCKFLGWYTKKKGGSKVKASRKVSKKTLYAHWEELEQPEDEE